MRTHQRAHYPNGIQRRASAQAFEDHMAAHAREIDAGRMSKADLQAMLQLAVQTTAAMQGGDEQ